MNQCYTLLLCLALFAGCKSAQKSYYKGDYADAIERGVRQLQKDPGDVTTRQIVQDAYNLAVARHESEIRELSSGKSDDRYGRIYQQYQQLQDLYATLQASPVTAIGIRAKDYGDYLATYRDKAAEVHTEKAARLLRSGNKQAFRHAYQEYKLALRYKPKDRELTRQRDSAYDAALTKVVVIPIQHNVPYGYSSSYQIQNFQNDVLRTLQYNLQQDFIKFYSEWEARSQRIEPDQIMELALGRIYLGQPYDRSSRRDVSKKVVVKETVYKPDSVVKEYATVRATIHTTERTLVSEGELFIVLRDAGGRIIWNDRFTGDHQWQTRFASYTGDERALSENDRNELNTPDRNRVPREEEVLEELFRRIQNDLAYRMRNYYARL